MAISSKNDLIQWCLRFLGEPVIKLDGAPEQWSDRVDEAVLYYQEFHPDGTQQYYIKHQLSSQDIQNKVLQVDPGITAITSLVSIPQSTVNLFDVRYQVMLNDFYNFNNTSMIHYTIMQQHLSLLRFLFDVRPSIRFNKNANLVYLDMDWSTVHQGDYVVLDAYKKVDPSDYPNLYGDRWLKEYACALIKLQWANNLSKFGGVSLLNNGMKLNVEKMKEEAFDEKQRLEDELRLIQAPVDFLVG
jgi:hypothetical protein